MFYATRTQQVTDKVTETQALSFYTKKDRDNFVNFIGGTAIGAKEYNKLSFADLKRTHSSAEAGCVFFAQRVM